MGVCASRADEMKNGGLMDDFPSAKACITY